jgi:hypothetical protein
LDNDDISAGLLLHKGNEQELIKSELEKYKQLEGLISSNIRDNFSMIEQFKSHYSEFKSRSKKFNDLELGESKFNALVEDWERDLENYQVIREEMDGLCQEAGANMKRMIELKNQVDGYLMQRRGERTLLVKRLENQRAEMDQIELRNRLAAVNVNHNIGIRPPLPLNPNGRYGGSLPPPGQSQYVAPVQTQYNPNSQYTPPGQIQLPHPSQIYPVRPSSHMSTSNHNLPGQLQYNPNSQYTPPGQIPLPHPSQISPVRSNPPMSTLSHIPPGQLQYNPNAQYTPLGQNPLPHPSLISPVTPSQQYTPTQSQYQSGPPTNGMYATRALPPFESTTAQLKNHYQSALPPPERQFQSGPPPMNPQSPIRPGGGSYGQSNVQANPSQHYSSPVQPLAQQYNQNLGYYHPPVSGNQQSGQNISQQYNHNASSLGQDPGYKSPPTQQLSHSNPVYQQPGQNPYRGSPVKPSVQQYNQNTGYKSPTQLNSFGEPLQSGSQQYNQQLNQTQQYSHAPQHYNQSQPMQQYQGPPQQYNQNQNQPFQFQQGQNQQGQNAVNARNANLL